MFSRAEIKGILALYEESEGIVHVQWTVGFECFHTFRGKRSQIVEGSCNYDVLLTAPLPDNLIAQNEGGLRTDWF